MNESIFSATASALQDQLVNRIVVAIIIFFVGLIIGRVIGKLVEHLLRDFAVDTTVKKHIDTQTSIQRAVGRGVSIVIYFIFLVIAFNYIGVVGVLFTGISIGILVVLSISLILAIRDNVPSLIAYRYLKRQQAFKKGDTITIGTVQGKVESTNLFETRLVTAENEVIHIPNSMFMHEQWKVNRRSRTK